MIIACNIGTCLLMAWNGAACLMYFINSIIWNSNSNNSAPVWCDICGFLDIDVLDVFATYECFFSFMVWQCCCCCSTSGNSVHSSSSLLHGCDREHSRQSS